MWYIIGTVKQRKTQKGKEVHEMTERVYVVWFDYTPDVAMQMKMFSTMKEAEEFAEQCEDASIETWSRTTC